MVIEMEFGAVGGRLEEHDIPLATWAANVIHEVEIVRFPAVPGPGQIGPHRLRLGVSYLIQVYRDLGPNALDRVDVQAEIDIITGLITMRKAPLAPDFDGRVVIEAII